MRGNDIFITPYVPLPVSAYTALIGARTGTMLWSRFSNVANIIRYVVDIPQGYPLEAAGSLFCSAITMYSPLAHWGVRMYYIWSMCAQGHF